MKKIHLSLELFNVDDNTLTPTLKVRRKEVYQKYKKAIDALYASGLSKLYRLLVIIVSSLSPCRMIGQTSLHHALSGLRIPSFKGTTLKSLSMLISLTSSTSNSLQSVLGELLTFSHYRMKWSMGENWILGPAGEHLFWSRLPYSYILGILSS